MNEKDFNFDAFENDLRQYDSMENEEITRQDMIIAISNWYESFQSCDEAVPEWTIETWNDFIDWCVENWEFENKSNKNKLQSDINETLIANAFPIAISQLKIGTVEVVKYGGIWFSVSRYGSGKYDIYAKKCEILNKNHIK